MGASESALSKPPPQWRDDEITTVSEGPQGRAADPILRRLQSLTVAAPLLTAPSAEAEPDGSLTDILLRKPPSASSSSGNLNPNVLLELFSLYREWQEEKAKKISKKQFFIIKRRRNLEISLFQYCLICNPNYGPYRHSLDVWEEIENKIETADALAVKLLQRFNYSVTSMRSTAHNLAEVHPLQVEVGELKGRLTEVINNCDALCKRIAAEGPESLRSSIQPFTASTVEVGGSGSLQPKPDC